MRHTFFIASALTLGLLWSAGAHAASATAGIKTETYVAEPMPPGFGVQASELDGPVFTDERGMTLYTWPFDTMRVGTTGDADNVSACSYVATTETAGMMSPYPPGLKLPELQSRKSCAETWPPVLAKDDAKPVGNFTIITRPDGKKQWAHNRHALYTSDLDKMPGDTFGATTRNKPGDGPAERRPAGPASNVPPNFLVKTMARGRMVLNERNFSIYTSDADKPEKSNCTGACATTWLPVLAAATALPQGEWTIFERSPGIRQWAFRKNPVYTYARDVRTWSQQGSDEPGWHNVYVQLSPPPPAGFSFGYNEVGETLLSPNHRTVYTYTCGDDSKDQLACDHPASPQVYRFAVCGGGNVERCLHRWPYVVAAPGAKSTNRTWSVISIDPKTGHAATAGQAGAINVWAYRNRPIFNFELDKSPDDIMGDRVGEFVGKRNGFNAFIIRDDFSSADS